MISLKASLIFFILTINSVSLAEIIIPVEIRTQCTQIDCAKLDLIIISEQFKWNLSLFKNKLFGSNINREEGEDCFYLTNDANITASISFCDTKIEGSITKDHIKYRIEQINLKYYLREVNSISFRSYSKQTRCLQINLPKIPRVSKGGATSSSKLNKLNSQQLPPRFIELMVISDYDLYLNHNSDLKELRKYLNSLLNEANSFLIKLNVRLVIVAMETWTDENKVFGNTPDEYGISLYNYTEFNSYDKKFNYDELLLFKLNQFNGKQQVLGMAYTKSLCWFPYNVGFISIKTHKKTDNIAVTIAHEVAHTFGIDHDKEDCKCGTSNKCIQNSHITIVEEWSDCSKAQFLITIKEFADKCLAAPSPVENNTVIPICGNGLLEAQEECDCLASEPTCAKCCDLKSCKLSSGSKCIYGECCNNCHLVSASSRKQCRQINSTCEQPAICDGKQAICPKTFNPVNDGTSCRIKAIDGICVNGHCKPRPSTTTTTSRPVKCPQNCNQNGRCDDKSGLCHCFYGFEGISCATRTTKQPSQPSSTSPPISLPTSSPLPSVCPFDCHGHGRCDHSSGLCICTDGFLEPNCELQLSTQLTPSGVTDDGNFGQAGKKSDRWLWIIIGAILLVVLISITVLILVYKTKSTKRTTPRKIYKKKLPLKEKIKPRK